MGRAPGPLRRWSLFFNSLSEAICFDFASILDGFGKPKWSQKSFLGDFFSMFFSNAILASFWHPKTDPKSIVLRSFFENVDFVKVSKNHGF